MDAPLHGLHVLELGGGIAVPYAGRLLAMLGATVAKVEPEDGDPARRKQVDDEPIASGEASPLYVHLNAGKRNVDPGVLPTRWADVALVEAVRTDLTGGEFDPATTTAADPLLVTVNAWGFDHETRGTIEDELLVEAASGVIAKTGDPGDAPLRLPGWQAQYSAGATAAVLALLGLRTGARHIDVSWLAAMQVGAELEFADRLNAGRPRRAAGAFPPAAFPGGALPCADGHVCPGSFRDIDWEMQTLFYGMPDLYQDERFSTRKARAEHVEELWELIEPWYRAHTKREIFQHTLDSPWTVGMVMTALDALDDEHLTARGTIGHVDTPQGPERTTVRPFQMDGLPLTDQRLHRRGEDTEWARAAPPRRAAPARQGLDGVRLLELTVAWAGPFVGNMLGGLGADVIRVETHSPFEGYRALRLQPDSDPDRLAGLAGTTDWLEASPLFAAVNRNKRGLALDLTTETGRQVFKDLVPHVDAVLCNFTAGVMPRLGLGWDVLSDLNDQLVMVRMPAFGCSGPYSDCAGYALIVEAMGGFSSRWGYEREGARVSDIYWPDSVAGTHAALAVAAGLERRDRFGVGCEIDLSHQDVMWQQVGEALITAARRGTEIGRTGNREPGVPGPGIREIDGSWWAEVGDRRQRVLDPAEAATSRPDRFERVTRPVIGWSDHTRGIAVVDGVSVGTRRPAPLFDEHTDEILSEIAGYDPDRLASLREAGVIGGALPSPSDIAL